VPIRGRGTSGRLLYEVIIEDVPLILTIEVAAVSLEYEVIIEALHYPELSRAFLDPKLLKEVAEVVRGSCACLCPSVLLSGYSTC
jgi:hypothetical protein